MVAVGQDSHDKIQSAGKNLLLYISHSSRQERFMTSIMKHGYALLRNCLKP